MLAIMLENQELATQMILECAKNGLILFWLLFEPKAVRISPPLTISDKEIRKGCAIIIDTLNKLKN